jgi:hypothetical protein
MNLGAPQDSESSGHLSKLKIPNLGGHFEIHPIGRGSYCRGAGYRYWVLGTRQTVFRGTVNAKKSIIGGAGVPVWLVSTEEHRQRIGGGGSRNSVDSCNGVFERMFARSPQLLLPSRRFALQRPIIQRQHSSQRSVSAKDKDRVSHSLCHIVIASPVT